MDLYSNIKKISSTIWFLSLGIVVYFSLSSEIDQSIPFWNFDKIYHVITYCWLAILPSAFFKRHCITQSTLFLFAMGVFIEIIQELTGRQFSFADMMANGIGIFIGWKLGLFLRNTAASQ
jgi:VanZ family protein